MYELVGSEDCKDFLGFDAKILADISLMISRLQAFKPYEYTCLFDSHLLPLLRDTLTPQQATNVVKKNIQEYKNNKDVFWYQRAEIVSNANSIKEKLKHAKLDKPDIVPICIDDYIELPIEHAEKPYKLLSLIASRLSSVGATANYEIKPEDFIACDIPIEPENGEWFSDKGNKIADNLQECGFLEKHWILQVGAGGARSFHQINHATNMWEASLTMHGWAKLSSIGTQPSNKVFIAMAFSAWDEHGKTEERKSLISAIKSACSKLGYKADIVSGDHTGNITDKIIAEIKRSKFMICDFTYQNQGAYYEAGYARALGKPVYHLVRDDCFNSLHFDIRQINCRKWTTPEEIENILQDWLGANE